MKKFLVTFFVLILVNDCVKSQDSIKIMPFGDSITELDWQGGYRGYLYKLLSDAGYKFKYVGRNTSNHSDGSIGFTIPPQYWYHEGYVGRAIYQWLGEIGKALKANVPDIILVILGTNDAANGTRSAMQIRKDMSALLDSMWKYNPKMKVILSTIPRIVSGSLFHQSTLDTIINANALWAGLIQEKLLAGHYILLVDNYSALNENADFTSDGVHPSVAGYKKMRYVWYPAVVATINSILSVNETQKIEIPSAYVLEQNYPNPFNPVTNIRYYIPKETRVKVNVYDALGRMVATLVDDVQDAGMHSVTFNASDFSSGVYLYTLQSEGLKSARAMVLLK